MLPAQRRGAPIRSPRRIDDGRRALEQTIHAAHAAEERRGEAAIAEQVVVEKVEMPARQPRDLRQRIVDALRVERSAAGEERVLVAEVTMLRAAARHDDGVGDEIAAALNEIAADGRDAVQRPARGRSVDLPGPAGAEVGEELREGLLARTEKDRISVRRRLVRQRRDVQAAERDERSPRAVVIGETVGAVGVGDVDLDDDQVRTVVGVEPLDVLVDNHGVVVGRQIRGERGEAERREQRVLDRTPVRAGRFGQGREDELDAGAGPST
jgi:hypothetical protein